MLFSGAVIHQHLRSITIVFEPLANGEAQEPLVITLAEPSIENGPLNIIIEPFRCIQTRCKIKSPVSHDGARLKLADAEICLTQAVQWNPKPDMKVARSAYLVAHEMQLQLLRQARSLATHATLLDLLDQTSKVQSSSVDDRVFKRFVAILIAMDQISENSINTALAFGAEHLAGLGAGLTPAGDDFLCGAMLAVWLARDDAERCCQFTVNTASRRTTTLSAALLRESAKGHCSMAWQLFFAELANGKLRAIEDAIGKILSHGATSGGDCLAGFLWAVRKMGAINHGSL